MGISYSPTCWLGRHSAVCFGAESSCSFTVWVCVLLNATNNGSLPCATKDLQYYFSR